MSNPLIIDWLDAFRDRTRLEKQEAIAECYGGKIRTAEIYSGRLRSAACCLNLIDLHKLWPEAGEDAWQNFVSVLQGQDEEEKRAAELEYGTRARKKPAEAREPIPPRHVAVEAPRAPASPYDRLMASFVKHGVPA